MASPTQKSVLFVYTNFASFVKTDFDILASVYNVDKYHFNSQKGVLNFISNFLKQFLFLVSHIRKYDAVFIWFADYHSFLPVIFARIFGIKSFLVIGGYDVFRIREINYGVFCSKIRGFFSINSMKLCTINLTVSRYVDRKVKFMAPNAERKLIYNCMNLNIEKEIKLNKENTILTVTVVDDERTFIRKGLDTFFDVARKLPDYNFVVVGIMKSAVKNLINNCPENILLYERIPHHELITFFRKAKVYCQLSRAEAFGVSIAEAMHFNCFPIVTNEGAMPEVIGNLGLVVPRNPVKIANTVDELIKDYPDDRLSLMEKHIQGLFSIDIRKEKLIAQLEK